MPGCALLIIQTPAHPPFRFTVQKAEKPKNQQLLHQIMDPAIKKGISFADVLAQQAPKSKSASSLDNKPAQSSSASSNKSSSSDSVVARNEPSLLKKDEANVEANNSKGLSVERRDEPIVITKQRNKSERTIDAPPGFKTDTEISALKPISSQRTLQRWSEEDASLSLDLESEIKANASKQKGSWNQFAENERLFGVRPEFNENEYTIPLTKQGNLTAEAYRKRVEQADRLAQEINSKTTTNRHLAEERGQLVPAEDEEEEAYGAVLRPKSTEASESGSSKNSQHKGRNRKIKQTQKNEEEIFQNKFPEHSTRKPSKDSTRRTSADSRVPAKKYSEDSFSSGILYPEDPSFLGSKSTEESHFLGRKSSICALGERPVGCAIEEQRRRSIVEQVSESMANVVNDLINETVIRRRPSMLVMDQNGEPMYENLLAVETTGDTLPTQTKLNPEAPEFKPEPTTPFYNPPPLYPSYILDPATGQPVYNPYYFDPIPMTTPSFYYYAPMDVNGFYPPGPPPSNMPYYCPSSSHPPPH